MLGKLIKHEWRATYKLMAAINLALVLLTLGGCCILNTDIFEQEDVFLLAVFLVTLYCLSLAAFGMATVFYLYMRFYLNLFGKEGYFMHTLPVTPMQLLHSKLIVGYAWTCLNSVLVSLSILSLITAAFFHYAEKYGVDSLLKELYGTGMATLSHGDFMDSFSQKFGYTVGQFFFQFLLLHFVASFASLLTGYVSILLGQLVEKYKRMASVGFYIALYVINQIVCSILMIIPTMQKLDGDMDEFLYSYCKDVIHFGIISQILMGALFYAAAVFLMRRRVNLD